MPLAALTGRPTAGGAIIEKRFRVGLLVASALTLAALLCHFGTMVWARNELSPPESAVAAQSLMLAHDGTLYYDLNHYPYTVCAYTPVFYFLEAGLVRLGLPAALAGRLITFAALIGLILLCGKLTQLYTNDRYAAWCARLFAASSPLLMNWGSVGQVDTLACLCSVAAFYYFSRFYLRGERTLAAAGVLAVLAMFTKQTSVAAPAAICLLLLTRSWKKGIGFGAAWAATVLVIALAINVALGGRFLADTVLANMNPMSAKKLAAQAVQFFSVSGGLLVLVAAGARKLVRPALAAPAVYLGLAAAVFAFTAPKIGSDTNYQIETTALLAICAAIALHRLNFFELYFSGAKTWITLLLLPAAVHLAVGYRATVNTVLFRIALENMHRADVAELRPWVPPTGGLVLCTDYNAMVRLRQRLDVEPLIYTLLVRAGAVNPEPVRRDLARGAFSTVVLNQNVFKNQRITDPELGTLPSSQLEEIRRHYHLVAHITTLASDAYVYKPLPGGGS
jgi:Dolichyl-phosphate-mannose-protein mannosyltransferase